MREAGQAEHCCGSWTSSSRSGTRQSGWVPSITSRRENRNRTDIYCTNLSSEKRNRRNRDLRLLTSVTRTFVRDVTVAVEIVELAGPPEVVKCVFVAEAAFFGTLGLRWRALGILVGVEWKSRHYRTSDLLRSNVETWGDVGRMRRMSPANPESRIPNPGDKMSPWLEDGKANRSKRSRKLPLSAVRE